MKNKKQLWLFGTFLFIAAFVFITALAANAKPDIEQQIAKPPKDKGNWVGAWAASPRGPLEDGISRRGFHHQTLRQIVHPHMEGSKLRIRLSNTFGKDPVTFDEVHVAVSKQGAKTVPGSDHPVTFDAHNKVTIPPGKAVFSDPVSMHVSGKGELAVSIYVDGDSGPATWHPHSLQNAYISGAGNHTAEAKDAAFSKKVTGWFWLDGIDVKAKPSVKG
ncbi:MAG TPA: SGNH/GDSL hydrolase family protein, partial [Bacillales bacterium]|nr:SGNH/GDSL hydrolase family protein [Bacillales bacterium]